MKMRIGTCGRFGVALSSCLIAAMLAGQGTGPARPDLGTPGDEHKVLNPLAGKWTVEVQIPIAPERTITGRSSCEAKWAFDGRFLRMEYTSTFAGKPLTVVRYLGFDRAKGQYVEVHFESTHTDVMRSEGDISKDGKTITCWGEHVDAMAGKTVKVRTTTTFLDADTFVLEMVYTDSNGKDDKTVKLTHKRVATGSGLREAR